MDTVVIETGSANIASVLAGLRRAGASPRTSCDPEAVRMADRVVLPGVGAFGAGMQRLREAGLVDAVVERVAGGRPLLGVCLGMQLLCRASEESPGVAGLGVIDATVTRFEDPTLRVPQLGWNRVVAGPGCELLRDGYGYFANSYRLREVPAALAGATAVHGGSFVAALERGSLLLCQFHPELSGAWGQSLLERWLSGGASC